jgi:hypothetical protein
MDEFHRSQDEWSGIEPRNHRIVSEERGWWIFKYTVQLCEWCGERDPRYPCSVTHPLEKLARSAERILADK